MKTLILNLIFASLLISCSQKSAVVEKTFHVWGNCEKCKATIDKAAMVKGVNYANWSVDSKLITLKLDTTATCSEAVLKAIAKAGYDNELYDGDDYAYQNLPQCCQYERKSN